MSLTALAALAADAEVVDDAVVDDDAVETVASEALDVVVESVPLDVVAELAVVAELVGNGFFFFGGGGDFRSVDR